MTNIFDAKKQELSNLIATVRSDTEAYNQKIRLVMEMRQTLSQYDYYKPDGYISEEEQELREAFEARLQEVGRDPEIIRLLKAMEENKIRIEELYRELGIDRDRYSAKFLFV